MRGVLVVLEAGDAWYHSFTWFGITWYHRARLMGIVLDALVVPERLGKSLDVLEELHTPERWVWSRVFG